MWPWDGWIGHRTWQMMGMLLGFLQEGGSSGEMAGWARGPWEQGQEGLQHRGSALPALLSLNSPAPHLLSSWLWRVHGVSLTHTLFPERRNLWLNIRGKEAAALSMFHVSMPLPRVSGGVLGPGSGCCLYHPKGQAPGLHLPFPTS